jgi:hypothetical protein
VDPIGLTPTILEEYYLLGYYAMQSGKRLSTFWSTVLPLSSGQAKQETVKEFPVDGILHSQFRENQNPTKSYEDYILYGRRLLIT